MNRLGRFLSKRFFTPISRSFRAKLLLILLLVAVVPLIVAALISYSNTRNSIETLTFQQTNTEMDVSQKRIISELDRIDDVLTSFYFDTDVSFYLNKLDSDGSFGTLGSSFYINKIKSYYFANYRDFESARLCLFDAKKEYVFSFENGFVSRTMGSDFFSTDPVFSNSEVIQFSNLSADDYKLALNHDGPHMVKFFKRFEDRKLMAALDVQLNWRLFDAAIELLANQKNSQIFLTRANGEIIYGHFTAVPEQQQLESMLNQALGYSGDKAPVVLKQYLFARELVNGIFILKTIPVENLRSIYMVTLQSQLLIILATTFLIIIIVLIVGYTVTRPITALAKSMHNIEKLLDDQTDATFPIVRSNDEIQILKQSYQMMIEKIRQLINQEYRQKLEKQTAQLMALQAQINPHFMFNTLQMIGAMAVQHQAHEVYSITSAFSRMLRYSMQMADIVTIGQEIANTENYLEIQKSRFGDKLQIVENIDENALEALIPKLTLQPIIENCFKYGFTDKKKLWKITLSVQKMNADIFITVADNGAGMDEMKVWAIKEVFESESRMPFGVTASIGLRNIHARTKLYFGPEYGLEIKSTPHEGTSVRLKIAAKGEEHVESYPD